MKTMVLDNWTDEFISKYKSRLIRLADLVREREKINEEVRKIQKEIKEAEKELIMNKDVI